MEGSQRLWQARDEADRSKRSSYAFRVPAPALLAQSSSAGEPARRAKEKPDANCPSCGAGLVVLRNGRWCASCHRAWRVGRPLAV
jgi:ssDNA-binding Zn-finger/Zn-ribbon topoisomerase 1